MAPGFGTAGDGGAATGPAGPAQAGSSPGRDRLAESGFVPRTGAGSLDAAPGPSVIVSWPSPKRRLMDRRGHRRGGRVVADGEEHGHRVSTGQTGDSCGIDGE